MRQQSETVAAPSTSNAGAQKLSAWRGRRSLTQSQAARLFRMNQAQYSHIELGQRRPGLRLATRMQLLTRGAVKMFDWYGPEEEAGIGVAAAQAAA